MDSLTKQCVITVAVLAVCAFALAAFLGSCHEKVYSTPPSTAKVVQPVAQVPTKPVAIPPKVAVHKAKKSTTCDPKEIGCGAWLKVNGKEWRKP